MPEREWSRPTAPTSQFPSFDQLDANRDGVITREEWSAGFGKAPPVDEQERLERNLAALAATVSAPATRRSPDYTSATFETFERGEDPAPADPKAAWLRPPTRRYPL